METNNLVLAEQFCSQHNTEFTFINSLYELGLIEIVVVEENRYLMQEQLKDIEKMIYFHYELNINIEGIDAISNLLKQVNALQQELVAAKNKVRFFETE
jgi:signal transduction histidine kinase